MNVLCVGLGKMGAPLARHLLNAGHQVTGVEPSAARREALRDIGFEVLAALPKEAPPMLVSSLPDDAALAQLAAALPRTADAGAAWIETSTVSPAASAAAAAHAAGKGWALLRAPLSGNAPMAERAQLSVLASGDPALYARCEPLLACWGPKRLYLGEGEQARFGKLAVNLMVAATTTMLAEAVALGRQGGIDGDLLWSLFEQSAIASPLLLAKAPALRAGDYTPTFTVLQMQKDLGLVLAAARELGVATPVAEVAAALLAASARDGDAGLDYAVVIRSAEAAAGLGR